MHSKILRGGARMFVALVFVFSSTSAVVVSAPQAMPAAQGTAGFQVQYPPPPKPPLAQIPDTGLGMNFQQIGHNALLDNDLIAGLSPMGIPRGGNGNLAVAAGPCAYAGSMTGEIPALVVDVSDPTNPTVVGPVPGHVPGIGHGIDDIDTIPDLNLMVIHERPAVIGGFDVTNSTSDQIYDITDCRNPRLVMNYPIGQDAGPNPAQHMSTIWRDPSNPSRVLHVVSFLALGQTYCPLCRPDKIDIRVVDLTGCPTTCNPKIVAEWGLEAEKGIPKDITVTYPDGTTFLRPAVTHQADFSVDGTRMRVTQLGMGFFQLDSSLLAKNAPCEPSSPQVGESEAARAQHCLKLLNPTVVEQLNADGTRSPGRASWDPPFFAGHVHTVANVPGKPYVVVADEPNAPNDPTDCPWSWMRILYVGDQERGRGAFMNDAVAYRGDLSPGILGTMGSMQNIPDRCPKPGVPASPTTYTTDIVRDDHGPHEPLIFPDLVIATYYSDGLKAFAIDNPLTPIEVGAFYNKPVDTIRFCWTNCLPPEKAADGTTTTQQRPDPSFGPVDLRAFSRPIVKDGLIYYVDANSGLYVVRYTGPHADQIPAQGICVTGNIMQAGFEPCPPYGGS